MKNMKKDNNNKAEFIGSQIRIAREEEGISQLDLAKLLDFESSTAISLIESGSRKITIENLEKIAKILHRDIYFFLGKDSKYTGDIQVALRSDKSISPETKKMIQNIIKMDKGNK